MGHMGVNRNVIHPRFGNYILLNTVLIDAEVDRYDTPSTTTLASAATLA
jgi:epoxyqueuosine reductase QueG